MSKYFFIVLLIFLFITVSCSSDSSGGGVEADIDSGSIPDSGGDKTDKSDDDTSEDIEAVDQSSDKSIGKDADSFDEDEIPKDESLSDVDAKMDSDSADKDAVADSDILDPDGMGPGTENPYEEGGNLDSVKVDENGELLLVDNSTKMRFLWVSNSVDGTVSKIDTILLKEVGRYYAGFADDSDPSRTTVDLAGNVFVGNRGNPTSVTKIAAYKEYCVERNGTPGIQTSSDSTPLPRDVNSGLSSDECVVWTFTPPEGDNCKGIRGMAATPETGGNFEYTGHVWVGCYADKCKLGYDDLVEGCPAESNNAYKLNGNTGDVIKTQNMTAADGKVCRAYGFVLDRDGRMWASCRHYGRDVHAGVGYFDSVNGGDFRFVPDITANAALWNDPFLPGCNPFYDNPLDPSCDQMQNPVETHTCNSLGFELIYPDCSNEYRTDAAGAGNPYGIAIDSDGYIWVTTFDYYVNKYIPGNPSFDEGEWKSMALPVEPLGFMTRGIAVDKDGFVWIIRTENISEIYGVDSKKFPAQNSVLTGFPHYLGTDPGETEVMQGTGVAVDFQGHVWGISRNNGAEGYATRLKIDRSDQNSPKLSTDPDSKTVIPVGNGPYMYSDMIGYNLRNFATKEGWYRKVFEICHNGSYTSTKWQKIYWESDVPQHTKVIIRARTAESSPDLENAAWIIIAEETNSGGDTSPKEIPETLPKGHFIEFEARLYTGDSTVSPKVGTIHFDYQCVMPSF